MVAFRDRLKGQIQSLALASGAPRTLATVRPPAPFRTWNPIATIAWSPDGRSLIFANYRPDAQQDDLWRVPVAGGQPERLGLTTDRPIHEIAVQPTGESIVVVMSDGERPGPRVIENLFPRASGR